MAEGSDPLHIGTHSGPCFKKRSIGLITLNKPEIVIDAEVRNARSGTKKKVAARQLLARTDQEIEWLATHGFAAIVGEKLVGFAAVEIYSRKLAEIQCLAVSSDMHGRGIGKRLIEHCVACARHHGILELMAISASDEFLKQCGFDYSMPDQKRALFIRPGEPHTDNHRSLDD